MKLWMDIKYAFRLLRKTPSFTAICLIVLILGVSISITAYSFVKTMYFKQMPFENGDRFVVLKQVNQSGIAYAPLQINAHAFHTIKNSSSSYETFGAFEGIRAVLSDGSTPEAYNAAVISPELLAATKVQTLRGRIFNLDDTLEADGPVALISEHIWLNYYAGDPNIIGRTSQINGQPYTIVGIMPAGFNYPINHQLWLPLDIPRGQPETATFTLSPFGVLKADISQQSATLELNEILTTLGANNSDVYGDLNGNVAAHALVSHDSSNSIPALFYGIAILILLISCINFSTLLFVRAHARKQELMIRSTMGATRLQLIKKILFESFLLCVLGSLLGVLLSQGILYLLGKGITAANAGYGGLPFWMHFSLDISIFMLVLGLIFFIWLISGSAVAFNSSSKKSLNSLSGGNKGAATSLGNKATQATVYIETIVSFFLLVLCGLFAVWGYKVLTTDYGVETDHSYTAQFSFNSLDSFGSEQRIQFIDNLQSEISQLSFVENVSFATRLPGQDGELIEYKTEDGLWEESTELPRENINWVSNNYFEATDITLLEGRQFGAEESAASNPTVIVDRGFAAQYWPGESAIGKRLQLDPVRNDTWHTIVGVVNEVKQESSMTFEQNRIIYRPYQQGTPDLFTILIRTKGSVDLATISAAIKEGAVNVNRNIPIERVLPLSELQALYSNDINLMVNVFVGIAIFAMLLAAIGIYGVISRSITQRTNEVGVRLAIGASVQKIMKLFLKQGLVYFSTGTLLGGGAALLVVNILPSSFASPMLAQLPLVLLTSLTLIGGLIFMSSYMPAKQALKKEPGDALRHD